MDIEQGDDEQQIALAIQASLSESVTGAPHQMFMTPSDDEEDAQWIADDSADMIGVSATRLLGLSSTGGGVMYGGSKRGGKKQLVPFEKLLYANYPRGFSPSLSFIHPSHYERMCGDCRFR